jgi:hypothetical protein
VFARNEMHGVKISSSAVHAHLGIREEAKLPAIAA